MLVLALNGVTYASKRNMLIHHVFMFILLQERNFSENQEVETALPVRVIQVVIVYSMFTKGV
jgi:hypothetical protein